MKLSDVGKLRFKCPGCGAKHIFSTWQHGAVGSLPEEIKPKSMIQCWTCLQEFPAEEIIA